MDCRKAFIGLGKNHPFPFVRGLNSPSPETLATAVTATDLDRAITGFMLPSPSRSSANIFFASHSCSPPPCLLLFCDLNIDQNDLADRLPFIAGDSLALSRSKTLSPPPPLENRDLDRRNGIAMERERRSPGSRSMRLWTRPTESLAPEKREKEDEEEEEEEELVA